MVAAVAASCRHGFRKEVRQAITLVKGFGVEGDAHGGAFAQHLYDKTRDPARPNLRQIHLLEEELILELNALGFKVTAGNSVRTSQRGTSGWPESSPAPCCNSARTRASSLRVFVRPVLRSSVFGVACAAR